MPAYNQGKYLPEAIKSLKKQTFQDFIIHVVDDNSNDGYTQGVLDELDYKKAKVFHNKDNRGVVFRSREHFRLLDADYVLVFCADDILDPRFLEKTVDFLDKNKDYGAVSVNIRLFEEDARKPFAEHQYDEKKMTLVNELARNQVLGSSLIRKSALEKTDLSGEFVRYQDWDRWISMLEAGWKIGLVPEFLFYYRQLPTSLSHSASVEDELETRKKLLKKHINSYKKYYSDVIMNMEQAFLELLEGKNWLDGQYRTLNQEIDRLNNVIKDLNAEIERRKSLKYFLKKRREEKVNK